MANDGLEEKANRAKALWKSGRDKYASFFTVIDEVRHVIGDAALPDWCFDELRIGMSRMTHIANVLNQDDMNREMAATKRSEKAKRDKHAATKQKLDAALTRIKELEQGLSPAVPVPASAAPDPKTAAWKARALAAEAELAALKAAAPPQPDKPASKPRRDRKDYMREFMRKKREAERRPGRS